MLWRGYTKSEFIAVSADDHRVLAHSRPFRWRGDSPPPEGEPYLSAHAALVDSLGDEGWVRSDEGAAWYELSFTREPGAHA